MKLSRLFLLTVILLLCGLAAFAQTPTGDAKVYEKDGLSFSYPAGFSIEDISTKIAVNLTVARADLEAQITVCVLRAPLDTAGKLAEAKKILVDRYIATTTKSFEDANGHPKSDTATSEIASLKAEGVKIHASLDGAPGIAEIEWAVVENHMVVLTILGADKSAAKAAPAWDMIRSTLMIAPTIPPAQSTAPKKPLN